ncbi:MAG: AEC family transporter [Paracoccaceae bacterium]|nr:AEC family transporter [Paracoccaceae bacterium]
MAARPTRAMSAVLAITLPIYLIIALGFCVTKAGYVDASDIRAVGKLVMRVCMPAMIFLAISRTPITAVLRPDFALSYLAGSLLVFGGGLLLARHFLNQPRPVAVLEALGMSASNSAFMGFPVAAMVVGDVALQAFTMTMLVENIVMMPLAVMLADAQTAGPGQTGNRGLAGTFRFVWRTLSGMGRNPLLLAVVAAVLFSVSGLALPTPLQATLAMLAPVAPPVALLAVGGTVATLAFAPLRGPMLWVVAGKLVAHPLAVLGCLLLAGQITSGPMPEGLVLSGVLIASVPMMSIYALFGLRWGAETLAASALILATGISFFTVSGMLWFIGQG